MGSGLSSGSGQGPGAITGTDSLEVKSLAILFTYLGGVAVLAGWLISGLFTKGKKVYGKLKIAQRWRLAVMSCLAVVSLAMTWFYMIAFLIHSYRTWASNNGVKSGDGIPTLVILGQWLKDSKLFKEAWETVIGPPFSRFWWSQSIFLGTAIWSIFLANQGQNYGISTSAYMLLGQLVAISFAQNLFYLHIHLHAFELGQTNRMSEGPSCRKPRGADSINWRPHWMLIVSPLLVGYAAVWLIPYTVGTRHFMLFLALPHVIYFLPALLPLLPSTCGTKYASEAVRKYDTRLYRLAIAISLVLHCKVVLLVMGELTCGGIRDKMGQFIRKLLDALYVHPAVSSVGWDVIMSTISLGAWMVVRPRFRTSAIKSKFRTE